MYLSTILGLLPVTMVVDRQLTYDQSGIVNSTEVSMRVLQLQLEVDTSFLIAVRFEVLQLHLHDEDAC